MTRAPARTAATIPLATALHEAASLRVPSPYTLMFSSDTR